MIVVYPSDAFSPARIDEDYAEEATVMAEAGFSVLHIDTGDFGGRNRLPDFGGDTVMYRGWMLNEKNYEELLGIISGKNGIPLVSVKDYLSCHHLPGWYEKCTGLTPETVIVPEDADIGEAFSSTGWQSCFVKDFVKSLTTSRGSFARSSQEAEEVVSLIRKYRGSIEGGVCLRKAEHFVPESERRHFVLGGRVFSSGESPCRQILDAVSGVDSPFFSLDTVLDTDGNERIVELGDGQVSGLKEWDTMAFADAMKTAFLTRMTPRP